MTKLLASIVALGLTLAPAAFAQDTSIVTDRPVPEQHEPQGGHVLDFGSEPKLWKLWSVANEQFQELPGCRLVRFAEGGMVNGEHVMAEAHECRYHRGVGEIRMQSYWRQSSQVNLCYLVAHELGHIAGLGHSEDPSSVMYAGNRGKLHGAPGCDRIGAAMLELAHVDSRIEDALFNRGHISEWGLSRGKARMAHKRYSRRIQRLLAQRRGFESVVGPGWVYSSWKRGSKWFEDNSNFERM